MKEFSKKTWKW